MLQLESTVLVAEAALLRRGAGAAPQLRLLLRRARPQQRLVRQVAAEQNTDTRHVCMTRDTCNAVLSPRVPGLGGGQLQAHVAVLLLVRHLVLAVEPQQAA